MTYSKENPSNEYLENLMYYKKMHKDGYKKRNEFIPSDATYVGISTKPFVSLIKKIIDLNQCKSLLDYGCGKAKFYEEGFETNKGKYPSLKDYWGIKINLYDPCVTKFDTLTKNRVDISICIDVLEHIPADDIDWVLDDFISLTNKFVFINVACYQARAILPNGKNAHINIKEYEWWRDKLLFFAKKNNNIKIIAFCNFISNDDKLIYRCIQINDEYKNYS